MTTNITNTTRFKQLIQNPVFLFWFYISVNLVPSIYFAFTQPIDIAGKIVVILFPLGLFMALFSLFKNAGVCLILCFPFLFLHAFQIVLFYLFGEDVIAADMFLNVATTNTSEINELLGSLLPSIAFVCLLYIPPIVLGILQWKRKIRLDWHFRIKTLCTALLLLAASLALSFISTNTNTATFAFNLDVYPINALHNLGFAVNKGDKVHRYPETSKDFTFKAHRDSLSENRQIYVLVIGETSRADNWSLYGYDRETNPLLKQQDNLIVYQDALTQSNTTHKSVSIILSDADAENYNSIYRKKGIIQAYKEAGFTTISLSNQAENASFIEYFTKEADIYQTLRVTDPRTRMTENHYDEELIALMKEKIATTPGDLFILLHTYGSHFKYMERYPEAFRQFTPDAIGGVTKAEKETLVNAYDNSILYTDYFLSETINALKETKAEIAMMYTSDHGEDLFDDERNRFLHASPSPTYYQLRIPILMWFSDEYITRNEKMYNTAKKHATTPIATNAVFHTMLDAAHIHTPYLEHDLSLVHRAFNTEARMYLNDHDIAVPYTKMNLKEQDFEMLKKNNIKE